MRILVVSDLPQFVTGGAEMQAARLIEAWLNAGHEVICLGRRMGEGPVRLGRYALVVHQIGTTSWLGRAGRGVSYFLSLAHWLLRYRRWADVVYTRFLGEAAVTVALLKQFRLLNTPLVATPANTHGDGDVRFLKSIPFSAHFIRLLDRQCNAINLIADAMAAELSSAGFSGRNFTHIPNGIPLRPLSKRQSASVPRLVAVGRLAPQKGYDLLLSALGLIRKQLNPGQVLIIGDGPESERLLAIATRLQLQECVHWAGEMSQDQIAFELDQAHVFLLPSRYEGLSNAGLEALERGLPLLLTRCGGLDLHIDCDTGWTSPVEDINALAEALIQVLSTPPDAIAQMGRRARLLAESQFDMAVIADRYLELFSDLASINQHSVMNNET